MLTHREGFVDPGQTKRRKAAKALIPNRGFDELSQEMMNGVGKGRAGRPFLLIRDGDPLRS